jgi:hypothetical protein
VVKRAIEEVSRLLSACPRSGDSRRTGGRRAPRAGRQARAGPTPVQELDDDAAVEVGAADAVVCDLHDRRRAVPRRPQSRPPRGEPDESPVNRRYRKSPVTRAFPWQACKPDSSPHESSGRRIWLNHPGSCRSAIPRKAAKRRARDAPVMHGLCCRCQERQRHPLRPRSLRCRLDHQSGLARKFAHVWVDALRESGREFDAGAGRSRVVRSTHAAGAAAGSWSRRRSRCRAPGMRADEGRPRGVGTCSPPTRSLWRDSTSRLGAPVGVNSPTL